MINSDFWLKTIICSGLVFFLFLALILWTQTPEMFEYFNQAFCAH